MLSVSRILFVCALLSAGLCRAASDPGPVVSEVRLKHGDDARWANPDWDDRDWAVIDPTAIPARVGIFWLRFRVRVPDRAMRILPRQGPSWTDPDPRRVNAIGMAFAGSSEFYWDGQLVWRNEGRRESRGGGRGRSRRERSDPGRAKRTR